MRTFFLLLALFSIPLAQAQRPENPFRLDVQVGAMLIGHNVMDQAFGNPSQMPGFNYISPIVWQAGLSGRYLLSHRLGFQGTLFYSGFRPQRNSTHMYQVVDSYTVYSQYKHVERPFQSLALSLNGCAALAFLGKRQQTALWLQAGGTLRRQWVSPAQSGIYGGITGGHIDYDNGIIDGSVGAPPYNPHALYGDTSLVTLRYITPSLHLGLSLEGLLNDRLSCYVAIDKDLLPYRQGIMGFSFTQKNQPTRYYFKTQSFFLETLSFGISARLWRGK